MSEFIFPDELAAQLKRIAEHENRSPVDVLKTLLDNYTSIDPLRQARLNVYAQARQYWEQVGDDERLGLSDEALDEHFWLIDDQGIPRFKSEQESLELMPDPLEQILGIFDDDVTDLSVSVRQTLQHTFGNQHDDSAH